MTTLIHRLWFRIRHPRYRAKPFYFTFNGVPITGASGFAGISPNMQITYNAEDTPTRKVPGLKDQEFQMALCYPRPAYVFKNQQIDIGGTIYKASEIRCHRVEGAEETELELTITLDPRNEEQP